MKSVCKTPHKVKITSVSTSTEGQVHTAGCYRTLLSKTAGPGLRARAEVQCVCVDACLQMRASMHMPEKPAKANIG